MPTIEEESSQPNKEQKNLSCPAPLELQAVKFRVKYLRDGRKVINGYNVGRTLETTVHELSINKIVNCIRCINIIKTPVEQWNQLIKHSLLKRLSDCDESSSSNLYDSEYESATPGELWKQLINK
uniref:Uncharacterized protein n=1 Tax=Acrobeloides nanus TaxID=290746 RepID=A0A914EC08_9BILA